MILKTIYLITILLLLFNNIFINATSQTDKDFIEISTFMKEICFDKSIIIIKDENAVAKFCDFVDHILEHDYQHVLRQYHRANKNLKPLELALGDTIKKRYYKKEERSHQLVDTFLSGLDTTTNDFLKKKRDEL